MGGGSNPVADAWSLISMEFQSIPQSADTLQYKLVHGELLELVFLLVRPSDDTMKSTCATTTARMLFKSWDRIYDHIFGAARDTILTSLAEIVAEAHFEITNTQRPFCRLCSGM